MEFSTKVNGVMVSETVEVYKYGPVVQYMKVPGAKTKQTEKVKLSMLMVTSMKVNGKMIRLMVMVSTFT